MSSAHFVITSTTFTCVKPGKPLKHQTVSGSNPCLTSRRLSFLAPLQRLLLLLPLLLLLLLLLLRLLIFLVSKSVGGFQVAKAGSFFAFDARTHPQQSTLPLPLPLLFPYLSPLVTFASSLRMSCGIVNMSYAL